MPVRLKRVYDPPDPQDGQRVLVDRLWPRGLTKEALVLDRWLNELAPSDELRRWFGHDPERFSEFRQRYLAELAASERRSILQELTDQARHGTLTLLFAARDPRHNQAVVLQEVIEKLV